MKSYAPEKIKGNNLIYRNQDYIVVGGKKLWIFRIDGSFVACGLDLRNINKVSFLSGNRLLVQDGKCGYHILSLDDGSEICRIPTGKRTWSATKFAVSPDELFAYDYFSWRGELFFAEIDLQNGKLSEDPLNSKLMFPRDIICDRNGVPCILQNYPMEVSGREISEHGSVYQYQDFSRKGSCYYWQNRWRFENKKEMVFYMDDVDLVLSQDLLLYRPSTDEMFSLLEKETTWSPLRARPCYACFDYSKNYVVLSYERCNVILDITERKVVSCYAGYFTKGCLINNEYWISSDNGILRKPFPLMEEIPPEPTITFF